MDDVTSIGGKAPADPSLHTGSMSCCSCTASQRRSTIRSCRRTERVTDSFCSLLFAAAFKCLTAAAWLGAAECFGRFRPSAHLHGFIAARSLPVDTTGTEPAQHAQETWFFFRPHSGHSLSASNDAVVLMLLKMDPWTLLDDHRQLELSDTLFSASRKRRRIDATCGDAMDAA
jgi:hypothetical protein